MAHGTVAKCLAQGGFPVLTPEDEERAEEVVSGVIAWMTEHCGNTLKAQFGGDPTSCSEWDSLAARALVAASPDFLVHACMTHVLHHLHGVTKLVEEHHHLRKQSRVSE